MMYPEDPDEPRLVEQAEALLSNWPLKDKQPGDWEALASSIDARVRITAKDSTPRELLEPPFADADDEEREVQRRSRPRMKRPAEGSLTALAQASLAKQGDGATRDEMARALLSQAVKARGETRLQGPNACSTTNRRGAPTQSTLGEAGVAEEPVEPPPVVQVQAQQPAGAGNADHERMAHHERRMWLGVAFGVLGMAAAAIMYLGAQPPERPLVPLATAPATELRTESRPAEPVAAPEPTSTLPEAVPLAAIPLDTEDAPLARAESAPRVASRPSTQRSAPAGVAPLAPEPASAPETPPTGPSEPGMTMADSHLGNIPDRPSTGAIQAAVGSVLGAARACVVSHAAASRASVHFASDGRVTLVAVSGPASGTGAERCIQAALAGARVQPFSRPSYVVELTVRP